MHSEILVETRGRGACDVTDRIQSAVSASGVKDGLCHVFIQHTSASLMISENADPDVLKDLDTFFSRIAPDGDPVYRHDAEGPDDMPAHIRSVLTQTTLTIPIIDGRCALGTWQGLYVFEHRSRPHARRLIVTVQSSGS